MKIFLDSEFTGLHKETTLLSIGLIAENGQSFYAELNDYDSDQIDQWLHDNVIENLLYFKWHSYGTSDKFDVRFKGSTYDVGKKLEEWLHEFEEVEIWSDCLAYDWVLFNNLFGHAFNIPKNVYYIPFDICTLFKVRGIDPDISREQFVGLPLKSGEKHNALHDARIIQLCYEKLMRPEESVVEPHASFTKSDAETITVKATYAGKLPAGPERI